MSSEKSSGKLVAELYAQGHPSGPKMDYFLSNPVDMRAITRADRKFGILCWLTALAGVIDAVISFCFSIYITFIATGVIWFLMAILWCLIASKFRQIAYGFGCQLMSLNIKDTLRRAPITQKEACDG